MKFEEYKEQVKRTLPNLGDWYGNPIILDSLHCTIGIFSEHYELDEAIIKKNKVNIGEEITDIAWYATNYCNVRGISPICILYDEDLSDFSILNEDARIKRIEKATRSLNLALSKIADYDKKEWAYRKPSTEIIDAVRVQLINTILNRINELYALNGLSAEQCMQNNIDKLRIRYPDKFNEDKANNRDLEAEKKELEK